MLPTTLVYHRLSDEPGAQADPFTVTPALFRAQMGWLARWGYGGVGLGAALKSRAARGRRVALTFDDGTEDFETTAWPELRARGWGATVCVVTGRVGAMADWDGPCGTRLLDWDRLRALHAAGVEVAGHGRRHVALDALPPDEAQAELEECYAALAREVAPPMGVAYPYGRGGNGVGDAAAAAGFGWGATARGGRRAGSPFYVRRTLVRGDDGLARFWLKVVTGYAAWVDVRMDMRGVRDEG